jgi:hypothetical protein
VVRRGTHLFLLDTSGGEKKLPVASSQMPSLSDDGVLIAEKPYTGKGENDVPRGNLAIYDVANDRMINEDVPNTGNSKARGKAALALPYISEDAFAVDEAYKRAFVYTSDRTTVNLTINEQQLIQAGKVEHLVFAQADEKSVRILFTNGTHELVEISSDSKTKDKKTPYPLIAFTTPRPQLGPVETLYHGVSNLLTVFVSQSDALANEQKAAVMAAIQSQNKDPNQIAKRWSTRQTVDPHNEDLGEQDTEEGVENPAL